MAKNYHLQTPFKCESLKFHVFIMQNVTQINWIYFTEKHPRIYVFTEWVNNGGWLSFLFFFPPLFFLGFIRYNELLSCIIFSSCFSMKLSVVLSLGGTLLPTNDNHQSLPLGKRNKLLIILTPMLTWRQCLSPSCLELCNLAVANKLWP